MVQAKSDIVAHVGLDAAFGTGTTSSGALAVATGLGKVIGFEATWTEDPSADSRWYWSAVAGVVTITSTNESKTFSWMAIGLN